MRHSTLARRLRRSLLGFLVAAGLTAAVSPALAFCGFYVGKADSSLFNEASQVILVRDGQRTVISMLNDYKGELKEFALVVPVPTVLKREQINVGERSMFDRIDAYSAPRLAEYHDPDPCRRLDSRRMMERSAPAPTAQNFAGAAKVAADTVKVEASYTVGEYDIVLLSATESDGLETWLVSNGYRIPAGASKALAPYIKQGLKFFVAKVNLKEHARLGDKKAGAQTAGQTYSTLRPLQFAFESPRFMLPMRLGMINANGPQDLIVYALTRNGRVEASNYRTVKLPANMDLPTFIRGDFKSFYKSMFDLQAKRDDYKTVFTEYFWDMSWCDPCAADPLSPGELRRAGVFWVDGAGTPPDERGGAARRPSFVPPSQAQPVMLTRLHVRYTPDSFPEDLSFQETSDRQNFQTRYVLRHPFKGVETACDAAVGYYREVTRRQEREADQLAQLTGWKLTDIRARMDIRPAADKPWWGQLWNG